MWRNILCQSAYQLAITLFLVYKGKQSFGIDLGYIDRMGFSTSFVDADPVEDYLGTFVFNTFVFSQVSDCTSCSVSLRVCVRVDARVDKRVDVSGLPQSCVCDWRQVFNEFNARSIGNDTRVYHGLHKNGIFMAIIIITIGLQIFIVEVGGRFTSTTGLSIEHWGWSIVMGFGSAPVGFLMRSIPVTLDEASFANYYNVDTTDRSGVRRHCADVAVVYVRVRCSCFVCRMWPFMCRRPDVARPVWRRCTTTSDSTGCVVDAATMNACLHLETQLHRASSTQVQV